MKKVQTRYQVVFIMVDGAELVWKTFSKIEHYKAYVDGLHDEYLYRIGIASIRYRLIFVE